MNKDKNIESDKIARKKRIQKALSDIDDAEKAFKSLMNIKSRLETAYLDIIDEKK